MSKELMLNHSLKKHLLQVKKAIQLTDIVVDDFDGIKCDTSSIDDINEIICCLNDLKLKLANNTQKCPVCGIPVYVASPHVTEEDGTKTHLECWNKK